MPRRRVTGAIGRAVLGALAASACAAPPLIPPPLTTSPPLTTPSAAAVRSPPLTTSPPVAARVEWSLFWRGSPIGVATESDDGRRFSRREWIALRRGPEAVRAELAIDIDRGPDGVPRRVTVRRWHDGPSLYGEARRTARGWEVELEGEPAIELPPAVPFELVVRDAARGDGFHGPVMLAGWGFAVAELALEPDADRSAWTARLTVAGRVTTARLRYGLDGALAELNSGDGAEARAIVDAGARPHPLVDAIAIGAIPVQGPLDDPAGIEFPQATAPPPPVVAGQRVGSRPRGWAVRFPDHDPVEDPALPAIAAIADEVAAEIVDDLGATAMTIGAALTATRGDCTTHALRFAAIAAKAGYPTRLVTGLRLDGDALVRHRWNLTWTGTRWIAVDPTAAQVPADGVIALAVHGARAADLAAADATVFDDLGASAVAIARDRSSN